LKKKIVAMGECIFFYRMVVIFTELYQ